MLQDLGNSIYMSPHCHGCCSYCDQVEAGRSFNRLPMAMQDALIRARCQEKAGDWLGAAATYASLVERHPGDHRFLANQGNALWLADLPAAAATAYRRALRINSACPVSRRGLASCLRDLNRFEEALALHRHLETSLDPVSSAAQANRWAHSQVLIGLEQFSEAFVQMACRRSCWMSLSQLQACVLAPNLILASEQGLGDSLQFVRFLLPLLKRRQTAGIRGGVRLLVQSPLVVLLRKGLAWMPDPPDVQATPGDLPDSDAWISLLELPGALGLKEVSMGSELSGYLRVDPPTPSITGASLANPGAGRLQIGLVSSAGEPGDDPFCRREFRKRSLPPAILWRLVEELRCRDVSVIDLQHGAQVERHQALGLNLQPPSHGLEGFASTAKAVTQLDLVITVDTAMAHLMGAMGRPCWVLLPWSADPRWLRNGCGTPWYPEAMLIRQPRPGDWHGAVDRLLEFLALVRSHSGQSQQGQGGGVVDQLGWDHCSSG